MIKKPSNPGIERIERIIQERSLRTRPFGRNTVKRISTVLEGLSKGIMNKTAWNSLSILFLGKELRTIPDSPLFYPDEETQKLILDVNSYPTIHGKGFLNRYYEEYVTEHDNPKTKWGLATIIREVYTGEILHEGPITIGKSEINGLRYLFVGHDKNYNQGRARTEDHQAVNTILKEERQGEYDRVVFFVDTPGADSGKIANDSQQAAVMSEVITRVSTLNKPTLTLLTGEGGSGGAEVFFGTDMRIAIDNAYFGTIHPIGHSAITKGKYSPMEIAWLLSLDAPHLYEKGVLDALTKLSLKKGEGSRASDIKYSLTEVIESSFSAIESKMDGVRQIPENERRIFLRLLKLRQKTASMLSDKTKERRVKIGTILGSPRYEIDTVRQNFDATIIKNDNQEEIRKSIQLFFMKEFENNSLTKFNVLSAIDTLITHVGDDKYSQAIGHKRNEIIGTIREELYHYQSFFWTLSMLIDPKNYDKFFSTSGTHADRLISGENEGLRYEKGQVEKFLRTIFESSKPSHVHTSYETWKKGHFSWLGVLLGETMDSTIELTKKFKQVHYDLPDTIVPLSLLLLKKFISSIFDDDYDSTLLSSDTLPIDFHAKHTYEQIRFYEALRNQLFGKRGWEEIVRKFFASYQPYYPHFQRALTTPLQDRKSLENKPQSTIHIGWGRIGYDKEGINSKAERYDLNILFGVIMLDFSVEGGAIDGAAAANIIKLIEQAGREKRPIIMFLQSAGMYVNGGPEAVSSMTAINFAIARYFEETAGHKHCQIFSIPFGICTGGTIASFAQAPGVHVLPLSLTDMPFAGRIVTLGQLPLESTIADFQVGKRCVNTVLENPFISDSVKDQIYEEFQKRGVDIHAPEYHMIEVIKPLLGISSIQKVTSNGNKEKNIVKSSHNLCRPYKKVAILNRGIIAKKAIESLENLGLSYIAFYTSADKTLPYITRASKQGKSAFLTDYMMSARGIVQAIKDSSCDAVYLGYGFWSEKDEFIQLCEENNIVVIGPSSENVERMGDKIRARLTFKQVLEKIESSESERLKYSPARGSDDELGGDGIIPDIETALTVANKIGYPVMIKAVYGGGGKGIRKVQSDTELRRDFAAMSREATESFGDGAMYMEKALENQRHIEVQIFADSEGNTMSLGVRDCTTQRNRQKIIEETGDLGINVELLARLQDIAVAVAKDIGYVGAGTFEFLYDEEKGTFTFMEMNTRIQVEHTVTERLIQEIYDSDINLVEMQFQVARGKGHRLLQPRHKQKLTEKLKHNKKHVLEIRICAEDPAKNFAQVTMGKITSWSLNLPKDLQKRVRFETYISKGGEGINHTSKYDSMFGQLIISGDSREEAIKNALIALNSLKINGIPTNKEFAQKILESKAFGLRELRISSIDEMATNNSRKGVTQDKVLNGEDNYFVGLTPFGDKIESVSEINEDGALAEVGEYVVRLNQDAKLTKPPTHGTLFDTNSDAELFEINMNKVTRVIKPSDLYSDTFYTKDNTGGMIESLPAGRYMIVRFDLETKGFSRGKALLILRPVNE